MDTIAAFGSEWENSRHCRMWLAGAAVKSLEVPTRYSEPYKEVPEL
jgi:hypothetical protein